MSVETAERPQEIQIDIAAQAAMIVAGAFAEQMLPEPDQDEYEGAPRTDAFHTNMDKFGQYYALGAFAETGEEAIALYDEHSAKWHASVHALMERHTELELWHEVRSKEETDDDEASTGGVVVVLFGAAKKAANQKRLPLFNIGKAA